jgi:glycosyltransferase involved in cell wall biosynthesis
MKIVHIEDFLHPDAGYQLNSLAPLQRAQGHDVTIITGELDKIPSDLTAFFGRDNIEARDAGFEAETGVKIIRIPLFGFYSGRAFFYPRIFKTVSALRPDVVFIHGEDTVTGMIFIRLSRWLRYPLVLDCHMVEMASLNRFRDYFRRFFKTFITPVILKENIPLIRVVDSDFVEKCLAIPLSRTDLLSFGTDTQLFSPDADKRRAMREQLGLSQEAFVVLYAGKLDETKGGKILASALAAKFPEANGRPIEFLVIGNTNGTYGDEVEAMFAASENKVVRQPTAKFRELARYYPVADLAVFPKQCSMSFFEIQACGVPVLFEENEINSQRCVDENGYLFEPGNADDLRAKISTLAATDPAEYNRFRAKSRQYIVDNFDYVPIAQQFTDVLSRAITQWERKGRRTFASPHAKPLEAS